jgi:hypothetical protein
MTDSKTPNLSAIAAILQSAGMEIAHLSVDYSPWREEYWSPSAQALLREQVPDLAETLIHRDLAVPDSLKILISAQNPYLLEDGQLQRQCERYFPATCLRWRQTMGKIEEEAIDKTDRARQLVARRESTADLYIHRPDGQKVRRSFFVEE